MSEPLVPPKAPDIGEYGLTREHLLAFERARENAFRVLMFGLPAIVVYFSVTNGVAGVFVSILTSIPIVLLGDRLSSWFGQKFFLGKPIRVVMLNDLVQMSRELAEDIGGDGSA